MASVFQQNKNRIYRSKKWRSIRKKLMPPGTVCDKCQLAFAAELHHKKEWWDIDKKRVIEELVYDISNLQPLCRTCHIEHHRRQLRDLQSGECYHCHTAYDEEKRECPYCRSVYGIRRYKTDAQSNKKEETENQ